MSAPPMDMEITIVRGVNLNMASNIESRASTFSNPAVKTTFLIQF